VDQAGDVLRAAYPMICDHQPGLGPAGGLLAAHRQHVEVAWLVTACDMPGLDESILRILVQSRNARRAATAFRSPVDGKVEPLCAIYEPATLARFSQRATAGRGLSPRDLLGDSDVEYVELSDPAALTNVNTPTDLETWDASPPRMSDEGTE
jgi:molybdopterin-guanine dinucleotide biosynthesis protein A